jgi:TetR/AcrR family transcriptional regulator, cholesterol catabolism regulator
VQELTPRQAERRERILRTVRDHLSRFGYEGLSMRDLAEGAEVSPTTLYNLYGNKDSLVLAAQKDVLEQLAATVSATGTSGIGRVIATAQAIADQVVRTPRYADAMARMMFNSDPADPICRLLLGDVIGRNRVLLDEMKAAGEIRADVDVEQFARHLAGDSWGTILLWMKGFIALQDLEAASVRRLLATLTPVMTQKALRRFAPLRGSAGGRASASV